MWVAAAALRPRSVVLMRLPEADAEHRVQFDGVRGDASLAVIEVEEAHPGDRHGYVGGVEA
jgi:hypothetical protein